MRFIGYEVNGKKFGCNSEARKKAETEAKKQNSQIKIYTYKI